jgi:hypothetical protein
MNLHGRHVSDDQDRNIKSGKVGRYQWHDVHTLSQNPADLYLNEDNI